MSSDSTITETTSGVAADTEPLLRISGVKKYFTEDDSWLNRLRPDKRVRTVRAVDGVDLDLYRGEIVGLVGESGCGKSTLARTVLRLLDPSEGTIRFGGDDLTQYSTSELRSFRQRAQMIYQDPFASLNPRYTVRQTLIEPMSVHNIGDSKRERIQRSVELLERVGLGEEHLNRYPHEFSGGQRQRVAIARAFVVEPDLLVADEPTSALDVSVQAQILNLLFDLQREMDLTILFITHDLSVVRRICDRVAVMYLGKIVEVAPTKRLFDSPEHPYTQSLMSSIPVPDPGAQRERIPLEGDVPTPIEPPSGCSFHPRCPKVIPPENWEWDHESWRRFLRFKVRVDNGTVQPDAMREELASLDRPDDDDAIIEALYHEHVGEWSGVDLRPDDRSSSDRAQDWLPDPVKQVVYKSLSLLIDRDRSSAIEALDEQYTTVCATTEPSRIETATGSQTSCHLYDDSEPGTPVNEGPLSRP